MLPVSPETVSVDWGLNVSKFQGFKVSGFRRELWETIETVESSRRMPLAEFGRAPQANTYLRMPSFEMTVL